MKNYSSYDGCTCHSNPPCSMCVNTFVCEHCGDIYDNDDVSETNEYMCDGCNPPEEENFPIV